MADNVAYPLPDGTTTNVDIAADDVASKYFQRVKLDIGGDGASVPVLDLATSAKQDTQTTALGTLATQTTAAAILAKLSADPATQTTLAAILAKILTAPATEAKQDTANTALATLVTQTDAVETSLASIDGRVNVTKGSGVVDSNTQRVVLSTDGPGVAALTNIDTNTAGTRTDLGTDGTSPPTLPGGSTGVRGWLRYLASLFPTSLGAKTGANSLSVVMASDAATGLTDAQLRATAVPVSLPTQGSSSTTASVSASASAITVLAANSARRGCVIAGNSTLVTTYLLFGSGTPSSTNYTVAISANISVVLGDRDYTGIIKGISTAATGAMLVTEFA